MLPHVDVGAVGDADASLGDDLFRPPFGHHPSLRHEDQLIAVLAGQVEVVQHDERGEIALRGEPPGEVEDLDLMVDIEMRGRLVEEQDAGLLGQRARDHAALPLAAREGCYRPVCKGRRMRELHRLFGNLVIPGPLDPEARQVWRASHEHDVPHGEVERDRLVLCHDRQAARQLPRVYLVDIHPVQERAPADRPQHPAQRADQGGLARPVGPHQPDELPPRRGQIHVPQHGLAIVSDCEVLRLQHL